MLRKLKKGLKAADVATLDGWTGSYFGNSSLAWSSNPDIDTCRISVVDDGADDAGAVYIHRENTDADGSSHGAYTLSDSKFCIKSI